MGSKVETSWRRDGPEQHEHPRQTWEKNERNDGKRWLCAAGRPDQKKRRQPVWWELRKREERWSVGVDGGVDTLMVDGSNERISVVGACRGLKSVRMRMWQNGRMPDSKERRGHSKRAEINKKTYARHKVDVESAPGQCLAGITLFRYSSATTGFPRLVEARVARCLGHGAKYDRNNRLRSDLIATSRIVQSFILDDGDQ